MYLRPLLIGLLACMAAAWPAGSVAQSDSLRAVVAEQRAALARADSIGDDHAAFEARMHLATLAKQPEALKLLDQAATLADSLQRPDLGAMARRVLAQRYAAAGHYAKAYAESLSADSLDHLRELQEIAEAEEAFAKERQRLESERDSTANDGAQRTRSMAQAIMAVQEKADGWMRVALASMVLGLLVVVWLLYRTRSRKAKLRTTMEALRERVKELEERESPRTTAPEQPPTPLDQAMKPVVEGTFRKAAPERLTTLRAARQRGDTEKVLRVLASLKPQLMAFDADRFGPLITRLRAPHASQNTRQWSADLDALEKGVEEWSQRNEGA